MRRRASTLALLLVLATAGVAAAADSPTTLDRARVIAREVERGHGLPVSGVTTTAGIATLELFDPATGRARSVPTADGIHFTLCLKALELARRTLLDTGVSLVVVALPQTATHHLQLVFERDLLEQPGSTAEQATRERLYLMAGIHTVGAWDSLLLVRLT